MCEVTCGLPPQANKLRSHKGRSRNLQGHFTVAIPPLLQRNKVRVEVKYPFLLMWPGKDIFKEVFSVGFSFSVKFLTSNTV